MIKLILKIKNLLPYLVLIAIYFFFINIEAKRNEYNIQTKRVFNDLDIDSKYSVDKEINSVIKLPVIQYNP